MDLEGIALVLLLGLGLGVLSVGILIRLGHVRNWVTVYRAFGYPWFIRNGPLALIPTAAWLILTPVARLTLQHRDQLVALALMLLVTPVILALMVTTVLWLYRPPDLAKPAWLLAEESRHGTRQDPSPGLAGLEKLSVLLIFAPLALAVIVALVGAIRWVLS